VVEAEKICVISPIKCLSYINTLLANIPEDTTSRSYFKLLILKFDALNTLDRPSDILLQIEPWLNNEKTPMYFQLYVNIYYAKAIRSENIQLGLYYLEKAKLILQSLTELYPKPIHLVQLVNLQLDFPDQTDSAYQMALELEKKYVKLNDPLVNMELYSNLGHLAYKKKQYKRLLVYRLKAKEWALKLNNVQQLAVASYNLARAYQDQDRLFEASAQFEQAISYAKQANDSSTKSLAQIYLAHVKYLQGLLPQAREIFNQIDASEVVSYRQALYLSVKDELQL
jgi:tetratricopeptide (TPR) repeat protein